MCVWFVYLNRGGSLHFCTFVVVHFIKSFYTFFYKLVCVIRGVLVLVTFNRGVVCYCCVCMCVCVCVVCHSIIVLCVFVVV